jgi:hypothetical protein
MCMGKWRYSSTILDEGTQQRWVVILAPWPLHPGERAPWYPLDRRLGAPQSWSGWYAEEKNLLPLPKIKPWVSSMQPITIPTELSSSKSMCAWRTNAKNYDMVAYWVQFWCENVITGELNAAKNTTYRNDFETACVQESRRYYDIVLWSSSTF